jgi:twitching motility two-component system response regulator PilH
MSKAKIMVVDDNAVDRGNLKQIVADAGFPVITADSGEQALEKAKAEKPSLIFMDIIMHGLDGYKVTRSLTANEDTKDIPIIFVSSKNQKADMKWAELQGGRGYITKPYSADAIVDTLKRYA